MVSDRPDREALQARRKRLKRSAIYAAVAVLFIAQLTEYGEIFHQSMPGFGTTGRMFWAKYFHKPTDERMLVRKNKEGICEWAPPLKLERSYTPPHTLLVAFPGSGKRLAWRIMESLTGYVTGDDWNLSDEGYHVASIKTSYPHYEGVWTWGDKFYDANIIFLLRNPRWAIPSYQTMRHELQYSTSWEQSYSRRPNTYTKRPDIPEWIRWRDRQFRRQLRMWGWMIDFYMNNGLRRTLDDGRQIIDWHCKPNKEIINSCFPKTIVSYEKLNSKNTLIGEAEAQRLADAMIEGREDLLPIAEKEDWRCAYDETILKRATEPQWDGTNRDVVGPPGDQKNFTWFQLQDIKTELERLITNYTNVTLGWDVDPIANQLVFSLADYLTEIDYEISITPPYTWPPTSTPSDSPSSLPTSSPTFKPTPFPTFPPTDKPTNFPTFKPTPFPTFPPTDKPTNFPTFKPTKLPTFPPTPKPTNPIAEEPRA